VSGLPRGLAFGLLLAGFLWWIGYVLWSAYKPDPDETQAPIMVPGIAGMVQRGIQRGEDFGTYMLKQPELEVGSTYSMDIPHPPHGRVCVTSVVVSIEPKGADCPADPHVHD
jgi:hypothetical protein